MKLNKIGLIFFLSLSLGQISSSTFYNNEKWGIRFYRGYATYRPLIAIIGSGDMPMERHETGIRGIDLSRKITSDQSQANIDWYLKFGFIRHLERGYQPNHNQYNIFLQAYQNKIVLGYPINLFIGEGLSYSELVPYVEGRETRRISGRDSKLMNYLNVGFDISTYHLFPNIGLINLYVGLAVSHRSGVYKQISFFNNTQGGGNFVTLFSEYKF